MRNYSNGSEYDDPDFGYVPSIRLVLGAGKQPKAIVANGVEVLRNDPALGVSYDTFTNAITWHLAPWRKGEFKHAETDLTALQCYLTQAHELDLPTQICAEAVAYVARENKRDSLLDYLNGLAWDGVPRVEKAFSYYWGGEPSPYLAAVAKAFFVSAVARAKRPGAKVDTVVVFEGPQGGRKSTALRTLGGKFFTDQVKDLSSKDTVLALQGKWIVELSELAAVKRSDVETIKAFVSTNEDEIRRPYARDYERFPRRVVFAATTNSDQYLLDSTGNRRFWPVQCQTIDIDALATDRDQLWAEAVAMYENGVTWWLNDDAAKLASQEQESRVERDLLADAMIEKANELHKEGQPVTPGAIAQRMALKPSEANKAMSNRITATLRLESWTAKKKRIDGKVRPIWEPHEVLPNSVGQQLDFDGGQA